MSITKQNLPEDIDVTDSNDVGYPDTPDTPEAVDFFINQVLYGLNKLYDLNLIGYEKELETIIAGTTEMLEKTRKPF